MELYARGNLRLEAAAMCAPPNLVCVLATMHRNPFFSLYPLSSSSCLDRLRTCHKAPEVKRFLLLGCSVPLFTLLIRGIFFNPVENKLLSSLVQVANMALIGLLHFAASVYY
jgi:hypothetical protein